MASKKPKPASGVAKRERTRRARVALSVTTPAERPRETLLAAPGLSDLDDFDDALDAMNRAATEGDRKSVV